MSDEQQTTENTNTPDVETQSTLSNADVKSSPLFQKLANKLAEFQRKEEERTAAEAQAAADAEAKRLADAGRLEEVQELHKKQLEDLQGQHAKKLLSMSVESELVKAGFSNTKFLAGSVLQYNAEEDGSPEEYAKKLAEDDANKALLAGTNRQVLTPPQKQPVSGSKGSYTVDQIRAMQKSDNPEDRQKVRTYLSDYLQNNGELPPGLRK